MITTQTRSRKQLLVAGRLIQAQWVERTPLSGSLCQLETQVRGYAFCFSDGRPGVMTFYGINLGGNRVWEAKIPRDKIVKEGEDYFIGRVSFQSNTEARFIKGILKKTALYKGANQYSGRSTITPAR